MSTTTEPTVAGLLDRLATFRYSLFRLETLQEYSGSSEDAAYVAWREGRGIPITGELADWCARTSRRVDAGAAVQRVHVAVEPLAEYMRFELASYRPNVEAGEDVRVLAVPGGGWPTDVDRGDFWLVDSRELWIPRYDDNGAWLDAERVTDPADVAHACFVRDAALAQATPWGRYMHQHEEF